MGKTNFAKSTIKERVKKRINVFARNVIGDCMCSEVLRDSTFALYDIDGARLKESQTILEAMRETMGGYGKIECYNLNVLIYES